MTKNSKNHLMEEKLFFFQNVIQKTILNNQTNKLMEVININDHHLCFEKTMELNKKIVQLEQEIKSNVNDQNTIINELQNINNDLSTLLRDYGTRDLEDLMKICFGNNILDQLFHKSTDHNTFIHKYELLKKHFHPLYYKTNIKRDPANKKFSFDNITIDETVKILDCFEYPTDTKSFYLKVYGMKLYIYNSQKSIMIGGIVDDVMIELLKNSFIEQKIKVIKNTYKSSEPSINEGSNFDYFLSSLNLRDFFIYSNETIKNMYTGYVGSLHSMKKNALAQNVKDFLFYDNYNKRKILIQLLLNPLNNENLYLAYLLYDLLSTDTNGNIDSKDQTQILDSFTWFVKKQFKHAIKKTAQYTNEITHFDINKIPLEQQICLMKAPITVKEKAMTKMKEIKSKNDDNGSKARQYLDGLLKIPFQIYKREYGLDIMNEIRSLFKDIMMTYKDEISQVDLTIEWKEKYTNLEIVHFIHKLLPKIEKNKNAEGSFSLAQQLKEYLLEGTKGSIFKRIEKIKPIYDFAKHLSETPSTKKGWIQELYKQIDALDQTTTQHLIHFLNQKKISKQQSPSTNANESVEHQLAPEKIQSLKKDIQLLNDHFQRMKDYLKGVRECLDQSVHGHEKAKKQIETIIAQWMNGEQDGYCFGFEGPPGVGKTSLVKYGLAECLKDENGVARPFAMIQIGGDCNGSTLHGHNYTYVGSTWGNIVQILMDKKCMNPIIFIDEVDKISKTEHGREIIGILTHLLDTTQNDCFQDKYFSGIDLDLSKALFILSYNDVQSIDHILLDRVHRIKFSHLSLEEKITISKKYILPEIYKKVGLENIIYINDETLTFIIDEYTCESGVRKLKEILFEIIGELNLILLKTPFFDEAISAIDEKENGKEKEKEWNKIPIEITKDDIKNKYFKDKQEVKHKRIHQESCVGIINGLWANNYGNGGVIPIQANFYPCDKYLDLKLTGMQGDVMKESMNVALTLAWNLTKEEKREELAKKYNIGTNQKGIHIHCPDGSVPKDGPSAGTAITTVIYSLLNDVKIKSQFAITGEISLDGNVTEIGGLDLKILGGIKSGVKSFIYPKENHRDFDLFMNKYKNMDLLKDISFYPVCHINDVFEMIFEK